MTRKSFSQLCIPHDDGILAIVAVVSLAPTHLLEIKMMIERKRRRIRRPHLERHRRRAALHGRRDARSHELRARAATAKVRQDSHVRNLRLVRENPAASIADDFPCRLVDGEDVRRVLIRR